MQKNKLYFLFLTILILLFSSCSNSNKDLKNEVVIYTSVDRVYSQIIFDDFYKKTGIKVNALYDVEASKTTGLVQRLIKEKENVKADVFWNGEIVQTIKLKKNNILEKYKPHNAENLKSNFIDTDNMWTAFGFRARIFLVNKSLLDKKDFPTSWLDISNNTKNINIGIAKPIFGTSATHIAALYELYGREFTLNEFKKIKKNKVKILDGNSVVRDLVMSNSLAYGLTDTDDALSAIEKNKNLYIVFPDQKENQIGTMAIPNSIALIKNGPNSENGKKFIEYLLDKKTQKKLIDINWIQIYIDKSDIQISDSLKPFLPKNNNLKFININFNNILKNFDNSQEDMKTLFLN